MDNDSKLIIKVGLMSFLGSLVGVFLMIYLINYVFDTETPFDRLPGGDAFYSEEEAVRIKDLDQPDFIRVVDVGEDSARIVSIPLESDSEDSTFANSGWKFEVLNDSVGRIRWVGVTDPDGDSISVDLTDQK